MSLYAGALQFPSVGTKTLKLVSAWQHTGWAPNPAHHVFLKWKDLSLLHKALTSTLPNTFGRNWNADWTPDLLARNRCLISPRLLYPNRHHSHALKSSEKPSWTSGGYTISKGKSQSESQCLTFCPYTGWTFHSHMCHYSSIYTDYSSGSQGS